MRSLRKRGQEPARQALYRMSGVNMTQIDAVGVETVQIVLSEYGPDLSRFPTGKQFISPATLAPRVPKSGNKPIRKKNATAPARESRRRCAWRPGRCAPQPNRLGAYYRSSSRRIGADVDVFATARKLASFIYRLLRWGQPYVDGSPHPQPCIQGQTVRLCTHSSHNLIAQPKWVTGQYEPSHNGQ
jgi:transposase